MYDLKHILLYYLSFIFTYVFELLFASYLEDVRKLFWFYYYESLTVLFCFDELSVSVYLSFLLLILWVFAMLSKIFFVSIEWKPLNVIDAHSLKIQVEGHEVFAKFWEGGYKGVVKNFWEGRVHIFGFFINKFFKNYGGRVHFYPPLSPPPYPLCASMLKVITLGQREEG